MAMIIAMIMVSLTASKKLKSLYISLTQSEKKFKGNPFLYFQFEEIKPF